MTEKEWNDCARVFNERIHELIPDIRAFWDSVDTIEISGPGVYTFKGLLRYMVSKTAAKSPIKGFQTFPFILIRDLNIKTQAICRNEFCSTVVGMLKEIEGMKLYVLADRKNNYRSGMVAFVPKEMLGRSWQWWVPVNRKEVEALLAGAVPPCFKRKMIKIFNTIIGDGDVI